MLSCPFSPSLFASLCADIFTSFVPVLGLPFRGALAISGSGYHGITCDRIPHRTIDILMPSLTHTEHHTHHLSFTCCSPIHPLLITSYCQWIPPEYHRPLSPRLQVPVLMWLLSITTLFLSHPSVLIRITTTCHSFRPYCPFVSLVSMNHV